MESEIITIDNFSNYIKNDESIKRINMSFSKIYQNNEYDNRNGKTSINIYPHMIEITYIPPKFKKKFNIKLYINNFKKFYNKNLILYTFLYSLTPFQISKIADKLICYYNINTIKYNIDNINKHRCGYTSECKSHYLQKKQTLYYICRYKFEHNMLFNYIYRIIFLNFISAKKNKKISKISKLPTEIYRELLSFLI